MLRDGVVDAGVDRVDRRTAAIDGVVDAALRGRLDRRAAALVDASLRLERTPLRNPPRTRQRSTILDVVEQPLDMTER